MFKNYKYLHACVLLILFSFIFNRATSYQSPGRNIANDPQPIYRNRVIEPERSILDIHSGSTQEKVVKLKNARIVLADYDLIRRDFPHIKNMSNEEIDNWILNQVGYISRGQAEQTVVNTQIPITNEFRIAYRPPEYGRALVYPMKNPEGRDFIGFMDVKGAGGVNPGQVDHGNGVATLGECVREFIFENLVRDVLDDQNIPNKTVGSYAVIDAGFGVIHKDGSSSPAGFYLRQAHHRVHNPGAWLDAAPRAHLESILHKYGIDPNKNIQGTPNNDILDFGHYVVRDDLADADPNKQIPFHLWGHDRSIVDDTQGADRWFYSKKDFPWAWSHELADAFANGRANRHDAWTHFQNLINPARAKLTTHRRTNYALEGYQTAHELDNFFKRMFVEKDLDVLQNIKLNLLTNGDLDRPHWKDMNLLFGLVKNMDLLPFDDDMGKLQLDILVHISQLWDASTPMPEELRKLDEKLSRLGLRVRSGTSSSCVDAATTIIAH